MPLALRSGRVSVLRHRLPASATKAFSALLRASNEIRRLVLLGAGASFRSGVPMAAEAVKRIAKAAYLHRELGGRVHPSQLKLSQWMPWLPEH